MKKRFPFIILISLLFTVFCGNGVLAEEADLTRFLGYFLNRLDPPRAEAEEKTESIKPDKIKAPNPIKGIYLTADTMGNKWGMQIIENLIANGGNAVVVDIEHGGGLLAFEPKNEFLKSLNPGRKTLNHLPEVINELHQKGIYVIARQVVFNDPYMGARKPEWRIKNRWGGYYKSEWLDPSMAGVQNYNLYTMIEVAKMGFDEIQFDYIRFPATNHLSLDYHYDENKFSRPDVINDFLKKARRVADDYGVALSVDVFGAIVWGGVDWKIVGQDAEEMAKYVDAIYPMTYPSHVSPGYYGHNNPYGAPYDFIYNSIQRFVEKVDGNAEIRTWVQGFPLKIPAFGTWFMEEQIKASFDAGATGYTIWSPGNIYTLSWPALALEPVTEPTEPIIGIETNPAQ